MERKPRNKLKSALLIVCVYGMMLVALEGLGQVVVFLVEHFKPSGLFGEELLTHQETLLGFGLKKSLSKNFGTWNATTNRLGFRSSHEILVSKPKNEIRIIMIGGSTVFGWGVDDDETIPFYLQNLVNDQLATQYLGTETKVKVLNMGVPWYSSWNELANIIFKGLPLNPDAVIVLNGLNDVAFSMRPDWTPLHLGYIDPGSKLAFERRMDRKNQKKNLVTKIFGLSPTLRYIQSKIHGRIDTQLGAYQPEVWDQYLRYENYIARLSSALGIQFHLFLQPVIAVERNPTRDEIMNNASALKFPIFAKTFRRLYLEGEARLHRQKLFPFDSLKSVFRHSPFNVYTDGLHYSAKANQILAKKIFEKAVLPKLQGLIANSHLPRGLYGKYPYKDELAALHLSSSAHY